MKKLKAKRKMLRQKVKAETTISLRLPPDVIGFYQEVATVSGVKLNDVFNVVLAIRAIKLVDAHA